MGCYLSLGLLRLCVTLCFVCYGLFCGGFGTCLLFASGCYLFCFFGVGFGVTCLYLGCGLFVFIVYALCGCFDYFCYMSCLLLWGFLGVVGCWGVRLTFVDLCLLWVTCFAFSLIVWSFILENLFWVVLVGLC